MATLTIETGTQFIQDVLECAVYIRPEPRGLTHEELLAVAKSQGYPPGTLNDALERLVRMDKIVWDGAQIEFSGSATSVFADFVFPLEPEYRNFKAIDAIYGRLRDLAAEHGMAMATATRDGLISHGTSLGLSGHDLAVAFEVLRHSGTVVQTKDDDHKWRLAPFTQANPHLPGEQNAQRRKDGTLTQRRPRIVKIYAAVQDVIGGKGAIEVSSVQAVVPTPNLNQSPKVMPDKKKVFVIHGRNEAAQTEMGIFLRAMGLEPLWFHDVRKMMSGTAYVLDVVKRGMEEAQGVIALFTADEFAALHPQLRIQGEAEEQVQRWQARPNVIFEAGLACGMASDRVAFVLFGKAKLFSDVAGIHVFWPTDEFGAKSDRAQLRGLLASGMKCSVNLSSDEWMHAGKFDSVRNALPEVSTRDPFH